MSSYNVKIQPMTTYNVPQEEYLGLLQRLSELSPFYSGVVLTLFEVSDESILPFTLAHNAVFARATPDEASRIRHYMSGLAPDINATVAHHHVSQEFEQELVKANVDGKERLRFVALGPERWRYFVVRCDTQETCNDLGLVDQLTDRPLGFGSLAVHNQGTRYSSPALTKRYQCPREVMMAVRLEQHNLVELATLYDNFASIKADFPEIVRALGMLKSLEMLPPNSDFTVLGLFAIIELLITHNPKLDDRGDSITHQMRSKIPLLSRRFHPSLPYVKHFGQTGVSKIWSALYSYRSSIAHGGLPDFSKGDFIVLKSAENATSFLNTTVRALIRYAMDEPDLYRDLKEC